MNNDIAKRLDALKQTSTSENPAAIPVAVPIKREFPRSVESAQHTLVVAKLTDLAGIAIGATDRLNETIARFDQRLTLLPREIQLSNQSVSTDARAARLASEGVGVKAEVIIVAEEQQTASLRDFRDSMKIVSAIQILLLLAILVCVAFQ